MGCECSKKESTQDNKVVELNVESCDPPINGLYNEKDKNHKSNLEIDDIADISRTNLETNIYRNKQSTDY